MGGAAHFGIVIIASLAGILFGFDAAVIAGITTALREFFRSRRPVSVRQSRCIVGHVARSNIVGGSGDRCVSRNMLRLVGMLHAISALGCALAWNFTSSVLCRFLAGIVIGGFDSRTDISRRNRTGPRIFASLMLAQFIAPFSRCRKRAARRRSECANRSVRPGEKLRAAICDCGTTSTLMQAIKNKENN